MVIYQRESENRNCSFVLEKKHFPNLNNFKVCLYHLTHAHLIHNLAPQVFGHGDGGGDAEFIQLLFYNFEVFLMHATDSYSSSTEVEDELAVTVYADNVAFIVFEWS